MEDGLWTKMKLVVVGWQGNVSQCAKWGDGPHTWMYRSGAPNK